MEHNMIKTFSTIYGYCSRNIQIVKRELTNSSIQEIYCTKDGLTILKSLLETREVRKNNKLYILLAKLCDTVETHENTYGDSTTFLTLMLLHLNEFVNSNRVVLQSNIQKELALFNKFFKKEIVKEDNNSLNNYIKTIFSNDPIATDFINFCKENSITSLQDLSFVNFKHKTAGILRDINSKEVSFKKTEGNSFFTYVPVDFYSNPIFSDLDNVDFKLYAKALTVADYETISLECSNNTILACNSIEAEVYIRITEKIKRGEIYRVVLPITIRDNDILKDLLLMGVLDAQANNGRVDRVILNHGSITLFPKLSKENKEKVEEFILQLKSKALEAQDSGNHISIMKRLSFLNNSLSGVEISTFACNNKRLNSMGLLIEDFCKNRKFCTELVDGGLMSISKVSTKIKKAGGVILPKIFDEIISCYNSSISNADSDDRLLEQPLDSYRAINNAVNVALLFTIEELGCDYNNIIETLEV